MLSFSPTSRLIRRQDLLASDLSASETVMMDIDQGLYFGLEDVAKTIWDYLAVPRTVADLSTYLDTIYDVDPQTLETDLGEFLLEMHRKGLVRWEESE